MNRLLITLCFLIFTGGTSYSTPGKNKPDSLLALTRIYYEKSDFLSAEKTILQVYSILDSLPDRYKGEILSWLGTIYSNLGRYKDGLDYYNQAGSFIKDTLSLGVNYVSKAALYSNQKLYAPAIEYYEKGLRTYMSIRNKDKQLPGYLSNAYYNFGTLYNDAGDYRKALEYIQKGYEIKERYSLSDRSNDLVMMAKAYSKLKMFYEAEKYYRDGIEIAVNEEGEDYYRLPVMYSAYSRFLEETGRIRDARLYLEKALSICLKNYGLKNTLTSQAFKNLADNLLLSDKCDSALYYYQQSIIAVVRNFNDKDIFSNPHVDSVLFETRLLDNLKSKSKALELLFLCKKNGTYNIDILKKSLETIELALDLIDVIRGNDLSEESRIYLAENEKETYIYAVHVAGSLYNIVKDDSIVRKIYTLSQRAKATILRNDIIGNNLLFNSHIPDTLKEKQSDLTSAIAIYNKLIFDQMRISSPDSDRISVWKDDLFRMNREREKISAEIAKQLPQYFEILRKTNPLPVAEIQKHLSKDETIIDYFLSTGTRDDARGLYTFVITHNEVKYIESEIDTLFNSNALILKNTGAFNPSFDKYTAALYYMYQHLIQPVENYFAGKKLIIIPDEEIEWLPFEAFLRNMPEDGKRDYSGLDYLINQYAFSCGQSTSLLYGSDQKFSDKIELFSFSPFYGISENRMNTLAGALAELKKVHTLFQGTSFTDDKATKENFMEALKKPAVFHLAMHSMSDSMNSRYSYMQFSEKGDNDESGRLFNYEISLARIKSPMVVLSACNSGTGTLYSGEGLMSIARSFILAGASSVVKTIWEVNDESSSEIISKFYYYLSKGERKDEALRQAKLDYLQNASPAFAHPYYWAAYEVLGNTAPLKRKNDLASLFVAAMLLISAFGISGYYFRRRRILRERSL